MTTIAPPRPTEVPRLQTLSDDWGCYPTPAGQAVYFTLAFQPDGGDA